mmetsp:Transcript_14094/g.34158  ORF Transcript_14094/g.34158 Transcript_14094/m.34158 type:complete len:152 (+) Transcript_14094:252-707(+)
MEIAIDPVRYFDTVIVFVITSWMSYYPKGCYFKSYTGDSSRFDGILDIGMAANESMLFEEIDSSAKESSFLPADQSLSIDIRRIESSLEAGLLSTQTFPVMEIRISLGPASDLHRDGGSGFGIRFTTSESRPLEDHFGLVYNKLPSSSDEQ